MKKIIAAVKYKYPEITFIKGDHFKWSSQDNTITYIDSSDIAGVWSLLHELGHAELHHSSFKNDMELLRKECEAWEKAQDISLLFSLSIPTRHIDACIDSYRDWIHRRSSCPLCNAQGIQSTLTSYTCLNCKTTWRVTQERLCRTYRLTEKTKIAPQS